MPLIPRSSFADCAPISVGLSSPSDGHTENDAQAHHKKYKYKLVFHISSPLLSFFYSSNNYFIIIYQMKKKEIMLRAILTSIIVASGIYKQ